MKFGETEIIRTEGENRLLKIGAKYEREVYCVLGGGRPTLHFDDYEDALEEFNMRWMQSKFGE